MHFLHFSYFRKQVKKTTYKHIGLFYEQSSTLTYTKLYSEWEVIPVMTLSILEMLLFFKLLIFISY